jgi:hypothetical protein
MHLQSVQPESVQHDLRGPQVAALVEPLGVRVAVLLRGHGDL